MVDLFLVDLIGVLCTVRVMVSMRRMSCMEYDNCDIFCLSSVHLIYGLYRMCLFICSPNVQINQYSICDSDTIVLYI